MPDVSIALFLLFHLEVIKKKCIFAKNKLIILKKYGNNLSR